MATKLYMSHIDSLEFRPVGTEKAAEICCREYGEHHPERYAKELRALSATTVGVEFTDNSEKDLKLVCGSYEFRKFDPERIPAGYVVAE